MRFRLSEADAVAAQRLVIRQRAGRLLLVLVLAALTTAAGLLVLGHPRAAAIFLAGLPVALALGWLLITRAWRRAYRAVPAEQRDVTLRYSPDGLVFDTAVSHGTVHWGAFSHYLETDTLLVLCQPSRVVVPLPKGAFTSEELSRLRALLGAHVPAGPPRRRGGRRS